MGNPFRSLRDFFENLFFADLKPDQPEIYRKPKLEALADKLDALISRDLKPDDKALPGPTSTRKKLAVALSFVLLAGAVATLVVVLRHPSDRAETAASDAPLPNFLPKDLKIDKNKDLDVAEIDLQREKEPYQITGTLKNRTGKRFARCEVSFDVTTAAGTQLGGVATTVRDLPPFGSAKFRIPVPQKGAAFAMVRELRAE